MHGNLKLASQLAKKGEPRWCPLEVEVHGSHRQSPAYRLVIGVFFSHAVKFSPPMSDLSPVLWKYWKLYRARLKGGG